MAGVVSVYQDCSDRINVEENGQFSYVMFNRFSRLGELRLLEWLSGDISAVIPPEPYRSQKNRDWLAPFLVKYSANLSNGSITRPSDYYLYQDLYSLSGDTSCDDTEELVVVKQPVEILSNDKFYQRARTFISGLRPSIKKPIAKQVGKSFEFLPEELGSVTLEYIRYPKFASIVTKIDTVYNEEVPNESLSINYEWDEWARELLVFFICDAFANRTREQSLKAVNAMTNKTIRESKT